MEKLVEKKWSWAMEQVRKHPKTAIWYAFGAGALSMAVLSKLLG